MAVIVFGKNRRQHPLRIVCPGGEVRISRVFGGAVVVRLMAGAGAVEEVRETREHLAELKIAFEERSEEGDETSAG
jgi:hypothetical protein